MSVQLLACKNTKLILRYDIWDLGEFDQKGDTRTKWGTRR